MSNEQPIRPEVIAAMRAAQTAFASMAQTMAAMEETLRGTLAALYKAVERADVPALLSDCTCEHGNAFHGPGLGCVALTNGGHGYCRCTSPVGGEL